MSESLGIPKGTWFPALRYSSLREQGPLTDGSEALKRTSGTEERTQPAQTDGQLPSAMVCESSAGGENITQQKPLPSHQLV